MNKLDDEILERVLPDASASAWARSLARSGIRRDTLKTDDQQAPQTWMAALWGLVTELDAAERTLEIARAPAPKVLVQLPRWWPLVIPPLWGAMVGVALLAPEFEDRLKVFGAQLGGLFVLGLAGAAWIATQRVRLTRNQTIAEAAARSDLAELRQALYAGTRGLLARSFAANAGDRLLVSTPHLSWLRRRIAALDRLGGQNQHATLRAELEHRATGIAASVERHTSTPPNLWTAQGLEVDLRSLAQRWRSAGLPVPHSEQRRWSALVGDDRDE